MDPDKLLEALTPIETRELIAALQKRGLMSGLTTPDGAATEAPVMTAEEFMAQLLPDIRGGADYLGGLRFRPAAVIT